MIRATVNQMRTHAGRLVAAGVAIVIATAFVTATLLSTGVLERTAYNAVLTAYPNADVMVTGNGMADDVLDRIRQAPGVAGADGRSTASIALTASGSSDHQGIAPIPETSALRIDLLRGTYPDGAGGIVVAEPVADRLGVDVGSTVDVEFDVWTEDATEGETWERQTEGVTVAGVFADPGAAFDADIPSVFASVAEVRRWSGLPDDSDLGYGILMAHAEPGTSPEELRGSLESITRNTGAAVRTADQYARDVTASFTSGTYLLSVVLMGFAAVALFAAGMVISNTFAVLVAQRRQQLALLRCVGATRRQVYRGVIAEAAAIGVGASLMGILIGVALAHAAVVILGWFSAAAWVPDGVDVPVTAVIVPLLAGTVVTLMAALSPARAATRVAPLAALRPLVLPAFRSAASRRRVVLTAALLLVGGALLGAGVAVSVLGGVAVAGLALGVLGGAISFVGVVIGAVVLVPPVVSAIGGLLTRWGGVPARMAAVNATRYPRRTASTAAALLIGVTLVAMMSVGASSSQATFDGELDERYPVDVSVGHEPVAPGMGGPDPAGSELPPAATRAVSGVGEVSTVLELRTVRAQVEPEGSGTDVSVSGVDPAVAREVVRGGSKLDALEPGTAVVPGDLAHDLGVGSGERLRLAVGNETVELDVATAALPEWSVIVDESDLDELAPESTISRLWLELAPGADAAAVTREIQDVISQAVGSRDAVPVWGVGAERAEVTDVLETMLAVVTGLLAVAVVIALIGVSNTLSLSVIERNRESATMRALGLTRRQLRLMLAFEGMLVAGVGALLGIGLGLVYGWLGTLTTLGAVWDTSLAIPWERLGLILGVSVVAGLLASALPGRRAARTPPVAALATE